MSFTEDARKLLQDGVAPELRAISTQFDSAEKTNAERRQVMLDKLDVTRREIMLQLELAMAKGQNRGAASPSTAPARNAVVRKGRYGNHSSNTPT